VVDELPLTDLRAFALELADAADALTLARFGGPQPAVRKHDGTPVTETDRAVEALLRERITATYPQHALLGEEQGGGFDPQAPTWVLDPIDATANYMRGIPIFGTLIAVVAGGRTVVGVASAPALGERWDAASGLGARRNGEPVAVSAVAALADAQVLHGGLEWFRSDPRLWELLGRITDEARRTRGFGDFWQHLLVAGGMAEVAFERDLSPWDVAAVECIVTESGGRCTGWDGGSVLDGGDVLSTNGLLHPALRQLLGPASAVAPA
jgi:histidinol-phosphatase